MEFVSIIYFGWLLVFLLVVWISAYKYSPYILTAFSAAFIFTTAPLAGTILFTESLLSYLIIKQSKLRSWKYTILLIIIILSAFLSFKYYAINNSFLLPLGISYFTFRLIHYIQDSHRNNIREHSLIEFLAYMTFFPTYLVGPINLFPEFLMNLRRRAWDSNKFSKGLERFFYGYVVLIIFDNYFVNHVIRDWVSIQNSHSGNTGALILQSAYMWLDLYVRFSAYSSIAIGVSAMAGFQIPENFNYPFLATNIREFWQRWHISLTGWCREYIFIPIAAVTRKPFVAIGATMITIGVWHELSIRYILWGLYHSVGIIIYQKWSLYINDKLPTSQLFQECYSIAGIITTIAFVVLSFPVTTIVTSFINSL